jgi:hypothetical protein
VTGTGLDGISQLHEDEDDSSLELHSLLHHSDEELDESLLLLNSSDDQLDSLLDSQEDELDDSSELHALLSSEDQDDSSLEELSLLEEEPQAYLLCKYCSTIWRSQSESALLKISTSAMSPSNPPSAPPVPPMPCGASTGWVEALPSLRIWLPQR